MAVHKVYVGTWDELAAHASELRTYPMLRLIVEPQQDREYMDQYRNDLTPNERIHILDELAERNRNIAALPDLAFDRESLYADNDEPG